MFRDQVTRCYKKMHEKDSIAFKKVSRKSLPYFQRYYFGKGRQEDIPFGLAIMANVHVQARGEYYDSGPAPSLS